MQENTCWVAHSAPHEDEFCSRKTLPRLRRRFVVGHILLIVFWLELSPSVCFLLSMWQSVLSSDAWLIAVGSFTNTRDVCCIKELLLSQVPHSHCSLRENPYFLQNFRPKDSVLRENFNWYFYLIPTIAFLAWP